MYTNTYGPLVGEQLRLKHEYKNKRAKAVAKDSIVVGLLQKAHLA